MSERANWEFPKSEKIQIGILAFSVLLLLILLFFGERTTSMMMTWIAAVTGVVIGFLFLRKLVRCRDKKAEKLKSMQELTE